MTFVRRMLVRYRCCATFELTFSRALRIISERATKGQTRDLLLDDLASKDHKRRSKALNAMWFLVSNRARMASTNELFDLGLIELVQFLELPCASD